MSNTPYILVTGGHGFVGTSVCNLLKEDGFSFFAPTHEEFDLTRQHEVERLFASNSFTHVIHLAGKVGGILANKTSPAEFFYQNSLPGIFLIHEAYKNEIKKFVGLAAGCGYPKYLEPPFSEEDFWSGYPDENSYAYSLAKKNLITQARAYKDQYGFNSTILLPANLYGPHDNFSLTTSHVVPALIRKFVEAHDKNLPEVEVWGSGQATREFLYVEDCAKAIIQACLSTKEVGPYNLGTGYETSIKDLVNIISKRVGYEGIIVWDKTKPDGQLKRFYDMSYFEKAFGWIPSTSLEEGIAKTADWYKNV